MTPTARADKLRDMKAPELARRAAFGAGVSIAAGVVGVVFGAKAGGIFLACPAILPATLTLVENKEGRHAAQQDEHGSISGALGLVAFAVAGALLVDHAGVLVAMAGATVAWIVVAMGAYALHEVLHARARGRLHPASDG